MNVRLYGPDSVNVLAVAILRGYFKSVKGIPPGVIARDSLEYALDELEERSRLLWVS